MEPENEIEEGREKEYIKKIEAALFISGKWLSLQDLIMLTDINPILIRELMEKLIGCCLPSVTEAHGRL